MPVHKRREIPKESGMTIDYLADQRAPHSDGGGGQHATSRIALRARAIRFALDADRIPLPISLLAAALCLTVGLVHVQDQGGFLGDVTPLWIALGYYSIEVGAVVTIAFIIRQKTAGWLLAALVSIGPFIAYILSRTVGLPGDPGDVGNWGYMLGTVSLVVEGSLFLLSAFALRRAAGAWRGGESQRV
jgi:hypothetical protein